MFLGKKFYIDELTVKYDRAKVMKQWVEDGNLETDYKELNTD